MRLVFIQNGFRGENLLDCSTILQVVVNCVEQSRRAASAGVK